MIKSVPSTFPLPRKGDPLHRLIEAEVIDPKALSSCQRDAVLRRLYHVHQIVFRGVSIEKFAHDIVPRNAARARVQIYRNECGALVGYCAVQLIEIEFRNEPIGVFKAQAGLLPGYRGSGITLWFGAKEAFRYKVLHPLRTVVLFAIAVHPSSYHMLSKYFWRIYPCPGLEIPERWRRLLIHLAELSGDEQADPSDPLIRQNSWITKESQAEIDAWQNSSHEDIRFYLSRNPGYVHGKGLALIAPLSAGNLTISFIQYLWHFIARWLEKRQPSQPRRDR